MGCIHCITCLIPCLGETIYAGAIAAASTRVVTHKWTTAYMHCTSLGMKFLPTP